MFKAGAGQQIWGMRDFDAEVLVIGAGPTGLFVAGELARHGVRARIIDRCPSPHTQTRATGIQPAVLEVLHRAGLAESFLAEAIAVKGMRVLDRNLAEIFVVSPSVTDTPFPETRSMAQWRTEEILLQRVHESGLTVERGVTAENINLAEDGVEVECRNGQGETFTIRAKYLVGAGGAHGPVRGALEQHLDGITYTRRYLVADVASAGVLRGDNLFVVTIDRSGMLMVVELPGKRTLVVADLPDDKGIGEAPGLEDLRKVIGDHLERPFEISDLRWISTYRAHRRMSPKFSEGRCFLAGDAAHLCSPLGGEGMNSGILDGVSLAWKLGAVLRRGGKPALLAAYETERMEIARQILASSEATHDFFYALVERARAGESLNSPPSDPTRKTHSPSMLDLQLTESPLLGFHGFYRANAKIKPGDRFPERARLQGCLHHLLVYGPWPEEKAAGFGRRWSRILEIREGRALCAPEKSGAGAQGAVLVRPDGYIGFLCEEWDDEAEHSLDRLLVGQFEPLE